MSEKELPTLPIGAVLQCEGWEDREVTLSYPGLCLAVTPTRQIWAMGYIKGAWRSRRTSDGFTVKPEPIEFQAEQRSDHSWVLRAYGANTAVVIDARELPSHINPHAVATAVADLLNGMANEVQP